MSVKLVIHAEELDPAPMVTLTATVPPGGGSGVTVKVYANCPPEPVFVA